MAENERKILRGWKEICDYTILCREHLIKHEYPIYKREYLSHGFTHRVYAYTDELDAHREAIGHGKS